MITDNPFLFMALIGSLLASLTSGIVGSYVVVKRIVFIAGSISHTVLGGMGICLWLRESFHLTWLHPLYGAILTAIVSSGLMGWIHLKAEHREDTVIAALWAAGMALGVIFVSLTPSYSVELVHFLFGNILWVSLLELWMLGGLGVVVLGIAITHHKKFTTLCFDETQVTLQGLSASRLYFLLLTLIALSVVLLIQVVGALLVIALLAIPPAIAGMVCKRLSGMIVLAIGISALFSILGMIAAYQLNWPPGATIAALSASAFLVLSLGKAKERRRIKSPL